MRGRGFTRARPCASMCTFRPIFWPNNVVMTRLSMRCRVKRRFQAKLLRGARDYAGELMSDAEIAYCRTLALLVAPNSNKMIVPWMMARVILDRATFLTRGL
jgi:hypothetical protein